MVGFAGRLTAIKRPLDLVRTLRALVDAASTPCSSSSATAPDRPEVEALAGRARRWPTAAASSASDETSPLVRRVRRVPADVGERGHAGRRDRGARGGVPRRRDRRRRHGDRRPGRRDRLPRGDRRHRRAGDATRDARPRPASCAREMGERGADGRARAGSRSGGWPTRSRRLYARLLEREGPPPAQDHRRRRLGAPPARRCSRHCASAASTHASSGSTFPGSDAPRFYEALDAARRPAPLASAAALDASPRMARGRRPRRARRASPTSLHTHLVHADVYGGDRRDVCSGCPSCRHATTTTATCSARSATSTARSPARPGGIIAISDAVHRFLERAGLAPAKLVTVHYGLDELPGAPSELTPADARHPARRTGRTRDRPADRAEGSRRRCCARSRASRENRAAGACSRSSASARSKRRPRRSSPSSGLDDAVLHAGAHSRSATGSTAPMCSCTRRAGKASGSCCSRRCSPGSRRRDAGERGARGRRRRRDRDSSSSRATTPGVAEARSSALLADTDRATRARRRRPHARAGASSRSPAWPIARSRSTRTRTR